MLSLDSAQLEVRIRRSNKSRPAARTTCQEQQEEVRCVLDLVGCCCGLDPVKACLVASRLHAFHLCLIVRLVLALLAQPACEHIMCVCKPDKQAKKRKSSHHYDSSISVLAGQLPDGMHCAATGCL